jgi:CIC family chloride channel protein
VNNIKERGVLQLGVLAIAVGVIAGLGAWLFRLLIAFFHNLLFLREFSLTYDANLHTPTDVWGAWVIAIPMVGALGVAWLVKTFAPEAKGHGVPEVMDAIHYNDGRIRPVVVIVKSLASALSIGSGGSVGREGPIIQIGATFGSMLGQWVAMPLRQRVVLMAAGAGAGIAATFNAPLGGILFAVELLLVSVNAGSILMVTLATITATFIGRMLLGATPSFDIPALQIPHFGVDPVWDLALFLPFGLICGLAATAFIRAIYWAEDRFDAMPGNYYTRHLLGMACVGVMIYLLQRYAGYFYVQGVGYAAIADILNQLLSDPWFLLLLFALKFLATCLTLGSGASGGVFSPSLLMGAALGAAFGNLVLAVYPGLDVGVSVFAIAGMAAMIGASTGAVFTGIVMIAEMTGDHSTILPVLLCTASAYALRKRLSPASIYTLKLNRRGHVVPEGLSAAISSAHRVGDIMTHSIIALEEGSKPPDAPGVVVWSKEGVITGVERRFLSPARPEEPPIGAEVARHVTLPADCSLVQALRLMTAEGADVALVSKTPGSNRSEDLVGVVTATELAGAMKSSAEML